MVSLVVRGALIAVWLVGFVFSLVFFGLGMEGLATSVGWIGTSGTLLITDCTGSGRDHRCAGLLLGPGDVPEASHVGYQGDAPVGSQVAVRVWSGDPDTAWPTGVSSWSAWLPELLGGTVSLVILAQPLVRHMRRPAGQARIVTSKLAKDDIG